MSCDRSKGEVQGLPRPLLILLPGGGWNGLWERKPSSQHHDLYIRSCLLLADDARACCYNAAGLPRARPLSRKAQSRHAPRQPPCPASTGKEPAARATGCHPNWQHATVRLPADYSSLQAVWLHVQHWQWQLRCHEGLCRLGGLICGDTAKIPRSCCYKMRPLQHKCPAESPGRSSY